MPNLVGRPPKKKQIEFVIALAPGIHTSLTKCTDGIILDNVDVENFRVGHEGQNQAVRLGAKSEQEDTVFLSGHQESAGKGQRDNESINYFVWVFFSTCSR